MIIPNEFYDVEKDLKNGITTLERVFLYDDVEGFRDGINEALGELRRALSGLENLSLELSRK